MAMHKNSTALLLAAIGIVTGWSSAATAQSPDATNPRCPVGYWLLESPSPSLKEALCLNEITGDVVIAEPKTATRVVFQRGCAPGYWRLDNLCLSSETGDVERVDEKRWPVAERAAARQ
jgi:hypothetical protein